SRPAPLFESPYYRAATLGLTAGATAVVGATGSDVQGGGVYDEGHVGAHALLARRVAVTAGRLALGGVAFDLARPRLPVLPGGNTHTYVARVTVRTESGPVYRWTEPATAGASLAFADVFSYPDARAEALDVYAKAVLAPGTDLYHKRRVPLKAALTQNAANAATGADGDAAPVNLDAVSGVAAPTAEVRAAQNALLDDDPGRTLFSGGARPYELLAERLSSPAPAGQRLQGFAAFGGALSAGQFGEYPLVALYDRSVFAASFTGEGELDRWRAVESERGAVGPQAFQAHGSAVYFLAADGLYALGASGGVTGRLSAPLQRLSGARPLGPTLQPSPASAVGVYDDGARLEVWVSSPGEDGTTWVYGVAGSTAEVPRWGRLARARSFFLPSSTPSVGLYGVGPAGLHAENDGAAERGDPFALVTAGVEVAGGAAATVARLGAVLDLACPVALSLYEDVPADAAPGERPDALDAPVFSGVLAPDQRFEMRLALRSRRFAVRLATGPAETGSALAPRVGDRLLSLTLATRGPVRQRRALLHGT
ncbi:MAG TPA: hypothetical protein VF576_01785, partial [Rubricoccaceae bacterium]